MPKAIEEITVDIDAIFKQNALALNQPSFAKNPDAFVAPRLQAICRLHLQQFGPLRPFLVDQPNPVSVWLRRKQWMSSSSLGPADN